MPEIDETIIDGIEEMLPLKYRNEIARKILSNPELIIAMPHRETALLFMFALPIPTYLDIYAHALELTLRDAQDVCTDSALVARIKAARNAVFDLVETLKEGKI